MSISIVPGQVGLIDNDAPSGTSTPVAFRAIAQKICRMSLKEVKAKYPKVRDIPYVCMDLVYQYSLLVDGFGEFLYHYYVQTCVYYKKMCVKIYLQVWSPPRISHLWRR
uniref:Uncharacterized protein n=1 Tax=Aegilops tauschii subsp. strangulata TaxID=200361 RepID=A0A453QPJ9_AEGTS